MSLPLAEIWKKTLLSLERELSSIGYGTWVANLVLRDDAKSEEGVITLVAPDITTIQTIQHRYLNSIQKTFSQIAGKDYVLRLELAGGVKKNTEIAPGDANALPSTSLRTRYVFDTFVKGKGNELAFAASIAVAESPGQTTYNPLFLYGGVGLGKTHLMHSIGNHVLYRDPYMKVYYTTSENLTNDFITSLTRDKMPEFRDKYRNIDVLLVDDIQFLSGKEGTQEEFFHTFNALYFANKQIVISSDKHPSELKTLEARLSSRFGSGLVVDITLPDYETRMAILEKKAELEKTPVPKDVVQYLAKNVASNIRELEGAFNKVVAQAKLMRVDITLALAEQATRDMSVTSLRREIDIPFIQEIVSDHYGVTVADIRSKKRTQNLSNARHVAMYLSRKILDMQLTSIGQFFGGKDHSTVVHAINKISDEIESNASFENTIAELEKRIKQG